MAEIQNVDKKSEGEIASGNVVRQDILDALVTIDGYVAQMAAGITVTGAVTVNNEAASNVTITNAAITVAVNNFGYDANAEQPLPGGTDGSGVLGWLAEINNQQINTAPTIATSGAYVVQPQIGINPVVGGAGATSAGTQRVVAASDSPDVTKLAAVLAAITGQSATLTQIDAAITAQTVALGTVTVNNFPALQAVTVSNFPATQVVTDAAAEASLVQIAAAQTNGNQTSKLSDGTNTLTLQTGDENAVPTYPQTKTVTQVVNATGTTAGIDTLGYTWAEVRGLAATTFSFTPQQAGDSAFATTVRSSVYYPAAQALAIATSGTITVNGNYIANILPLQERYVRANVTVLTGGPTSIVWILHSGPVPPAGELSVSIAGTNTPQQGSGQAASPWTVSGKAPVTSLNAALTTAAGTALDCTGAMPFPTLQVHYGVTPATVAINLEGSNNGSNWVILGTSTSVASADFTIVPDASHQGVAMREYRANLTTLTGASASVTALVSAGA